MSHEQWAPFIRDMIRAIDEIQFFVAGLDLEDFITDIKTQRAVTADFAMLGEACGRVPDEIRDSNPHIPWRDIRRMRNFVVHVYDAVKPSQLWATVQQDLPPLRLQLAKLLEDYGVQEQEPS